jgi:hypothetical protein
VSHQLAAERAHLDLRPGIDPIDPRPVDQCRQVRQPHEQAADVLAVIGRAEQQHIRLALLDERGKARRDGGGYRTRGGALVDVRDKHALRIGGRRVSGLRRARSDEDRPALCTCFLR